MEGLLILVGIVGLAIFIFNYLAKGGKKDLEQLRSVIELTYKNNDFSPSKEHFTFDLREGIAYDYNNNLIMFLKRKEFNFEYVVKIIPSQKVLQSKIIENGETVTQTSRTSQVTGIAVGSLLAGGIGAIIGGLSSKTYSDKNVNELHLELILDDVNDPIARMRFLYNASGLKQNSEKYKEEYNKVYYWHKLIEVLMHQNKSQTM